MFSFHWGGVGVLGRKERGLHGFAVIMNADN